MPTKYNVVKERRGSDEGQVVATFDSQSDAEQEMIRLRDEFIFVVMAEEPEEEEAPGE